MKKTKLSIKISFNSPVILGFVGICFIAMILGMFTKGKSTELLFMTYHSSLLSPLTYVRFFTHIFGHSGWEHFVSNMIYILLLGPMLEEKYGSKCIIGVIALTAVITGVFHYIFFYNAGLLGASGVCFAFIILASITGIRKGEIPLTFILVVAVFIGQQVFQGLTIRDDISNISHIIGGIVGGAMGFSLNKR